MKVKFKFMSHTADIKFRAYGKTINEAFENSAKAMFVSMYSGKVVLKKSYKITVGGKDLEALLYNFLEKLIVLLDSKNLFVAKTEVKIDIKKLKLKAMVYGDDAKNYNIGLDVKAITYNDIFVKKDKGQWICQVVVDV